LSERTAVTLLARSRFGGSDAMLFHASISAYDPARVAAALAAHEGAISAARTPGAELAAELVPS
jgi:hypothetical protein